MAGKISTFKNKNTFLSIRTVFLQRNQSKQKFDSIVRVEHRFSEKRKTNNTYSKYKKKKKEKNKVISYLIQKMKK